MRPLRRPIMWVTARGCAGVCSVATPTGWPITSLSNIFLHWRFHAATHQAIGQGVAARIWLLAQLISADPESLRRVDGLGDTGIAALKIVQATSLRLLKGGFRDKPLLSNWDALLDWLRADMAPIDIERVRVLYLNSRNMLIRDELVSEGSIDQSAIYVREIVKRALELGASAIIVVHNHPSGSPRPSRQDIAITRDIADAAGRLGIALHDHIIVGGAETRSFRAMGLL